MVLMPSFTPTLAALALTSLVILVSNTFRGPKKIAFQSFFFLSGLSCALTYLVVKQNELTQFFAAFSKLSGDLRLALSVLVIVVSYFGGAMYIGGPPGWIKIISSDYNNRQIFHLLHHESILNIFIISYVSGHLSYRHDCLQFISTIIYLLSTSEFR